MYFSFECPQCQKRLRVKTEAAGRKANCPYCRNSIVVPSPSEVSEELPATQSELTPQKPGDRTETAEEERPTRTRGSDTGGWSDRTDVSVIQSGLVGILLTAVIMIPLWFVRDYYVGKLFYARGWVPPVETFCLSWSMAILLLKWRKIRRQRESMLLDLLPNDISEDIDEESVGKFVDHIEQLPLGPNQSFLINRVVRGLEHFRVRKSNPEVASLLASQSEIDSNAVQSSYSLVNVFIWAIPILGFIGTVAGISAAVEGFSSSLDKAADIAVLKESLNDVTSGLATAFDTTLLALLMSMMVMFPSSSLLKAEEDILNSADEYCNENLLKRLRESDAEPTGGGPSPVSPAGLRRMIDAALAPHHAELRTWNEKLEAIGSKLTAEVVRGWGTIGQEIAQRQQENAERVREVDAMVASFGQRASRVAEDAIRAHEEAARTMHQSAESFRTYCGNLQAIQATFEPHQAELRMWNEKLEAIGSKLTAEVVQGLGTVGQEITRQQEENAERARAVDAMLATFGQASARLSEETIKAHQAAAETTRRSAESFQAYCAALELSMKAMNDVVGRLGEKRLVIHMPRRRGWFSRRWDEVPIRLSAEQDQSPGSTPSQLPSEPPARALPHPVSQPLVDSSSGLPGDGQDPPSNELGGPLLSDVSSPPPCEASTEAPPKASSDGTT